jgi:hypothetical protein
MEKLGTKLKNEIHKKTQSLNSSPLKLSSANRHVAGGATINFSVSGAAISRDDNEKKTQKNFDFSNQINSSDYYD